LGVLRRTADEHHHAHLAALDLIPEQMLKVGRILQHE
jgi:hypothetical protein